MLWATQSCSVICPPLLGFRDGDGGGKELVLGEFLFFSLESEKGLGRKGL